MSSHAARLFELSFLLVLLAPPAGGQTGGGPPPGLDRERMWWAPTAEDWKKPCLIPWQRSWEDALAVSKETGRALLVCVNMDGEIASEHYAGVRYRQPEIAKLYEPYVCVIASVYRHTPRDHDEQGRRILCPRFGSVTCGEHIAIEPGLYERFMDGQRVAPRHIGVELDRSEMYDVFYAWDTDTIFNSLRDGIANRPDPGPTMVRGDRPVVERVASRDIQDRIAVEAAYQQGDPALRRALLEAAGSHAEAAPVDLLRLAVFGFDAEMSQLARRALAGSSAPEAVGLIGEALRVPMDPAEREALVATLDRLGAASPRAATLAVVHRALAARSPRIDVDAWTRALAAGRGALDPATVAARLDRQDVTMRSNDATAHVELAEAFLGRALEAEGDETFSRYLLLDARRAALRAEQLGAYGGRASAVLATVAFHLGEIEEARARATAAAGELPPEPGGASAALVLEQFARARQLEIGAALRERRPWPPEWLADVHAAYGVLARHPFGGDAQVADHYDLLRWLGAAAAAGRVLEDGLARFPDSWALHDRLRARILAESGVEGLEPAYEALRREQGGSASLAQAAGYTAIVAAEFHRRAGSEEKALAAYARAVALYEAATAAEAGMKPTSDHFAALALAGRARIACQQGDLERALADLVASFERCPDAAGTLDGLNLSPADTSRLLRARLEQAQRAELVARLDAALGRLDPELLRLPAYERGGAPPASGGRPRRDRNRRSSSSSSRRQRSRAAP